MHMLLPLSNIYKKTLLTFNRAKNNIRAATTTTNMPLYHTSSLLHIDSLSDNSCPLFPPLALASNRYNSYKIASKTT